MTRLTEAELEDLKTRNPCDAIAGRWVTLRRGGKLGMIGPCPLHSPDPHARDSTAFECGPDGWVCATCADGGDVIKLVMKRDDCDFMAAVEYLGGARQVDAAEAARAEKRRAALRAQRDRESRAYRERERQRLWGMWHPAATIAGTDGEAYLARRRLALPPASASRPRFLPQCPMYADGSARAEVVHRGPAMLAAIVGADGRFAGLHITWIDLGQPKGKAAIADPASGALLPAKKVRGSKAGGRIELVPKIAPKRLVIGEGIETVLAMWTALAAAGRDLADIAFWSAIDLGNIGGKAAATVAHPTLKTANQRAQRVPGPEPDLAAPGLTIPDSVEELILLGDGDSDRFLTECTLARAAARFGREGRVIRAAWAPAGRDINDLLFDQDGAVQILAILDAAAPPAIPVVDGQADSPSSANKGARKRVRSSVSAVVDSNVVAFPGSDAASSSSATAAAAPPRKRRKKRPSQEGASASDSAEQEAGRGGAAGARAKTDGPDKAELDRRLAWLPQTDLGNAERFVERNRGKLLYCQSIGWMWWDGKRFCREGAIERVLRAEHETVRGIQEEAKALEAEAKRLDGRKGDDKEVGKRKKSLTSLAAALRFWGRKSEGNSKMTPIAKHAAAYLSVETDRLDADLMAINVRNGTLVARRDWSNEPGAWQSWPSHGDYIRLKPHDPADLITKLAPATFDPKAECPQFLQFLAEVQPDKATRQFLQQWKGYSITGDTSEHCMALFIGQGRNGKSVFEDVTAHVAGDYAETVPIETFLASGREANANAPSPARALLHNARMVRTSEPNKGAAFDEGFIKLVTGGEPIQARNLNLPMFRFYPHLKLTVSGNHRPKIGGADEGIWSRVTLVPFGIIIPPEKRDRKLSEKLRGEASGILNWILDGLSDWIENGLQRPEEVKTATAEYRRDSDQLGRFFEHCVVMDPESRTQSSLLLAVFNAWARVNGGTEWTNRGLANAMTERGFKKDKSSVMFWLGIKLIKHEGDFDDGTRASGHSGGGRRPGDDEFV